MGWQNLKIRAPHLKDGIWLNVSSPPTIEQLVSDGIVLVDFWDYSCVNCVRTLPYLIEWHERYADLGLRIVGIHSPEFAFGKQEQMLAAAVRRFGIDYAVLMDNDFENWYRFSNRAWPTKYLIDHHRIIRYSVRGEGRYGETEEAIQSLLRELHGEDLELPPLMTPLRPTDMPGALCYRTTPELYAGYAHGRLGNSQPFDMLQPQHFIKKEGELEEGLLYFEGIWQAKLEYSETVGERCALRVPYHAAELNAVLASADGQRYRLYVEQDGQPLTLDEAGEDVVVDSEVGSYVMVSTPRMYNLVINPDFAHHEIILQGFAQGLQVYSFTFVSCPKT